MLRVLRVGRALTSYWAPVDESDIEPEELMDPKLKTQQEKDRAKRQGKCALRAP